MQRKFNLTFSQYRHNITEILLKVALNTINQSFPSVLVDKNIPWLHVVCKNDVIYNGYNNIWGIHLQPYPLV